MEFTMLAPTCTGLLLPFPMSFFKAPPGLSLTCAWITHSQNCWESRKVQRPTRWGWRRQLAMESTGVGTRGSSSPRLGQMGQLGEPAGTWKNALGTGAQPFRKRLLPSTPLERRAVSTCAWGIRATELPGWSMPACETLVCVASSPGFEICNPMSRGPGVPAAHVGSLLPVPTRVPGAWSEVRGPICSEYK